MTLCGRRDFVHGFKLRVLRWRLSWIIEVCLVFSQGFLEEGRRDVVTEAEEKE